MEKIENFQRLKMIGQGSFGTVYKAINKRTGAICALKHVKPDKEGVTVTSFREIQLLYRLKHGNIIQLQKVIHSSRGLFLVMDYGGLDLAYQFDNLSLTLSEHSIKKLMKQLLGGLAYLHQQGILHRDLKLSNILYDDGEVLKICDFGLAKQKDQVMTKGVVTLWYRAPELLLGSKGYTEAVDMWAVGCIFAELLNGGHPVMPGKSEAGQFQMICKLIGPPSTRLWPGFADVVTKFSVPANQHNTLNVLFSKYSQRCIDFLNQLLVWDPAKRLTAAEALLSSYLNY